MKNVLAVLFAVAALAGGIYFTQIANQPPDINAVFDQFFQEFIIRDPEWMTYLGDLRTYGVESRNGQLQDRSDLAQQESQKLFRKTLASLETIDAKRLSRKDAVAKEVIEWYLKDRIEESQFLFHPYLINQMDGVQISLPDLLSNSHPLLTKQDATDYIGRLWQFGRVFDQVIAAAKERESAGFIPPAYIINSVLNQCYDFTSGGVENNMLLTSFKDRLMGIMGLSEMQMEVLVLEAAQVIENVVFPAYERLVTYLEEMSPKATLEAGVWELPDGDAYYLNQIRHYTTTNLSPEEIHTYGQEEVERILTEMRTLYHELGIEGENMATNMRRLGGESFFDRESIFHKYQEIYDSMEQVLPQMFTEIPETRMQFAAVPEEKERFTSNYYLPPALDASRAGIFYVNTSMPQVLPHMLPLAYHEGIPGHHLQLTLTREADDLHVLLKLMTFDGYTEGWALYAEKLAGEFGFYPETAMKLGSLHSELLRAARLVIDTGLHYKKWTRNEAIDYLNEVTGMYRPAEIDRYIVWPGQALAYKVGELKMLELRNLAETALKNAFDLKEFHTVVLQNGAVPLEVLEKEVMHYIDSKK